MEQKSLFDQPVYDEILARVGALTPETQPKWGKMNVAQMMDHMAEVQDVSNGTRQLEKTPFIVRLFKGMIRKGVVNNKPYKHNNPTHPQYRVTDSREFEQAKTRLLESLSFFNSKSPDEMANVKHALFGTMTLQEKGWSCYKHLDHHLTQFGV